MDKEVELGEGAEESWLNNPAFLLPRFNTVHSLVQKQVEYNDINAARQNYQRLLALYDEINRSGLPASQKQEAYRKLMDVFSALSNPDNYTPRSNFITIGKYLFPISLMVIVLLIIIFAKPEFSLTGLAVFGIGDDSAPEWVGGNPEFDIIGKTTINLDTYFKTSIFDKARYSVTDAPNLDISIDGSLLTIKADYGIKGVRVVDITASDSDGFTKVTARLNIY
jgi:hypothetical protein